MSNLFGYLDNLPSDSVTIKELKIPQHWKAESFAIATATSRNIYAVIDLLKKMHCYKNISQSGLEEIVQFVSNSQSGHKFFS